jgi:hypothetical protein
VAQDVANPSAPPPSTLSDPDSSPPPETEPLKVDINQKIAELVAQILATPRFEEEIEVRDHFQEALDAHLHAAELQCGTTAAQSRSVHHELDRYGANPKPPSADLLTPAKLLFGKLKGLFSRNTPRYFVYSVRPDDAPERVLYVVLDGPISATLRYSVPGTSWELLAKYSDREKAADSLTRLERGDAPIRDADAATARTLWAATRCED